MLEICRRENSQKGGIEELEAINGHLHAVSACSSVLGVLSDYSWCTAMLLTLLLNIFQEPLSCMNSQHAYYYLKRAPLIHNSRPAVVQCIELRSSTIQCFRPTC